MEIALSIKKEKLTGPELYEILQGITPGQCEDIAKLAVDDHLGSLDDDVLYIYRAE